MDELVLELKPAQVIADFEEAHTAEVLAVFCNDVVVFHNAGFISRNLWRTQTIICCLLVVSSAATSPWHNAGV